MGEIPRQIDRYPIIKSLGQGGMGEVYLAFDPICERKIAIKCIRGDLLKHKNITTRFLNEAKIASQLSHPSIIPIYSIHSGEEKMYYIMPYVEGQTLKEILRETHKSIKKGLELHPIGSSIQSLIRIFLHICHAISFSHAKGFLHRDVKPENVIVGKFGEVQVLDWGLAEKITAIEEEFEEEEKSQSPYLTRIGKIVGTLSYMPPERAMGNRANVQTDIYALGVILYQMLTLKVPFKRKTLKEFQKNIEREQLQDPAEAATFRDIPKVLCDITKKTLAKDPSERYLTVDELIHDIEKYLEGRPDWILETTLDINESTDFAFQETVLLNPHSAITQLGPLSQWVILMIAKGSYPGNIKIEASITLNDKSEGIGLIFSQPSLKATDALQRGFCIWLGSKKRPSVELFLDNVRVLQYPEFAAQGPCHLCIEKIDSNVFFSINDKPIFTYVGHIPTIGSQIGLICKDMLFSIENWRVYSGSQNAMVDCLSIPDAFFAEKNLDKAFYEYRKIADSFKGRTEAREAIFRSGITLIEKAKLLGDTSQESSKLMDKAYAEFEKLKATAGAPLEYLGKSLIYKEEGDYVEEAKCLELALRRYENHPLIPRIHEHIIFRFHEISNKDRHGTYLFALLVIRFVKNHSRHNTQEILDLLKQYLQPLHFLQTPKKNSNKEHLLDIAIQLCFWLKKPLTLMEIAHEELSQSLLNNLYFSLLYLDELDYVQKLLHQYPNPIIQTILEMTSHSLEEITKKMLTFDQKSFSTQNGLLYLVEKNYVHNPHSVIKLFDQICAMELIPFLKPFFDNIYIQTHLLLKNIEQAKESIQTYDVKEVSNPTSPLYPSFALIYQNDRDYQAHIHKLLKEKFPPISSFVGHIMSKNYSLSERWMKEAFFFEKKQYEHYLRLINQFKQATISD